MAKIVPFTGGNFKPSVPKKDIEIEIIEEVCDDALSYCEVCEKNSRVYEKGFWLCTICEEI
jgi:hypothetical protein